jgi:hypothetical protein
MLTAQGTFTHSTYSGVLWRGNRKHTARVDEESSQRIRSELELIVEQLSPRKRRVEERALAPRCETKDQGL